MLSQTSKDSTIIPDSQLRLALQLVEKGKQCEVELSLQKEKNSLLVEQVSNKNEQIASYKKSMQTNIDLIKTYEETNKNLSLQKMVSDATVKSLQSELKRTKIKTVTNFITGTLLGAAITYVAVKLLF